MCQLKAISDIGERKSWLNDFLQIQLNNLREVKKKAIFMKNMLMQILKLKNRAVDLVDFEKVNLHPGDWVRVRSKKEIKITLDDQKKYKGCRFLREMYKHCGKTYRVFKTVDYFFDESRQKMCKCHDTVILDGAICSGKLRLHKCLCDRNCFFFWQTAWLEKIE